GIVTFPFLIFDLPALIRKRTFKEVISASAILHRFNFLKFIGAVIFIPALIFASIACYILVDQTIIEGPTFMRDLTTRSAPTEEALQTHAWRQLKTAISFSNDISNQWVFSPNLIKNQNQLKAQIRFLRNRGESFESITLGPIDELSFPLTEITLLSQQDPFFRFKYPSIHREIGTGLLTEASDAEVMELFFDTLNINLETLPRFLTERGTILTPYLTFKRYLMDRFAIGQMANALVLSRRHFLELSPNQNNFFLITSLDGKLIQLKAQTRGSANSELLFSRLKNSFLNGVNLRPDAATDLSQIEKWSIFDWLDFFAAKNSIALSEASQLALRQFIQELLSEGQEKSWAKETVISDYRRMMQLLQEPLHDSEEAQSNELF